MNDKATSLFEAYLKGLSSAEAEKIHKDLMKSLTDGDNLEKIIQRRRVKGLKLKEDQVFEVEVIYTCITCGNVVKAKIPSAWSIPMSVDVNLCGKCEEVLQRFEKDELVQIIIKKERAYYGKPRDYAPHYRSPIMTLKQLERMEEEELSWNNEAVEVVAPEEEVEQGGNNGQS